MKKWIKKLGRLLLWLMAIHMVYTLWVWVLPPPITATMLGSLMGGHGLSKDWISLPEAGKNMPLALIAAEDQEFANHNGFDWKGIQQAIEYNEKHEGKKLRGGSTISQQVAKNVFLWQGRSYLRKGLEVYCTFWIELLYSKRRILELYINVAETGEGLFGVEAAAQHYFGKPASKLTANEAARIAACLPAPKRYKAQPPTPYVKRRAQWIQRQMRNIQDDTTIQAIIATPQ